MSVQDEHKTTSPDETADRRRAGISRRDLLKRGVVSMPAILTLHSGAALARSSNLIAAAPPETTDSLGRTLCLDTTSVYPAHDYKDIYDMDDPPQAVVNIISRREYHMDKNRGSPVVSQASVCEGGTVYWYKDPNGGAWQPIELPYKGVVVSSGSMLSNADYIIDNLR